MTILRLLIAGLLLTPGACTTDPRTASSDADEPGDEPNEADKPGDASSDGTPAPVESDADASSAPGSAVSDAGVAFGGESPTVIVAAPDAGEDGEPRDAGPLVLDAPSVAPSFERGLSFGNRLDAPNEGDWGPRLRDSDFATLAARGFDHVRLPVRFSGHADATTPFTLDAELLLRVDWAITQALSHELSLVLDFQYYDELMQEPDAHRERFLALWTQLAERYRELPPHVAFELLSEPNGALESTYEALVAETLTVIRESNPERTVIVDSFDYARVTSLSELQLPDDENVVASVHFYLPQEFAFQGAPWADARLGTTGVVFPGPPAEPIVPVEAAQNDPQTQAWFDDYNTLPEAENPSGPSTIDRAIAALVEFREQTGHDVYVGEFGATTYGPEDSRSRYFEAVRSRCEAADIGWAVWDNNGSDMAVLGEEEGTFLDSTIDALIPVAD